MCPGQALHGCRPCRVGTRVRGAAMCRRSGHSHRISLRQPVWLATACCLLAAYWPRPAYCQEAVLEEVTVTAQRRTERLQDVPVAVTAISGSELIARGVR